MVILAAAKLDDLLKTLLQSSMLHQSGNTDPLFDSDHALCTFSSRILLSYRLGLIDRDVESFLQTLRKLRNDAAHSANDIDLRTAPHIDRVLHLQMLASKSALWGKFDDDPLNTKNEPAASLFQSLLIAVFNFECVLLNVKQFVVETPCSFNLLQGTTDESC